MTDSLLTDTDIEEALSRVYVHTRGGSCRIMLPPSTR